MMSLNEEFGKICSVGSGVIWLIVRKEEIMVISNLAKLRQMRVSDGRGLLLLRCGSIVKNRVVTMHRRKSLYL